MGLWFALVQWQTFSLLVLSTVEKYLNRFNSSKIKLRSTCLEHVSDSSFNIYYSHLLIWFVTNTQIVRKACLQIKCWTLPIRKLLQSESTLPFQFSPCSTKVLTRAVKTALMTLSTKSNKWTVRIKAPTPPMRTDEHFPTLLEPLESEPLDSSAWPQFIDLITVSSHYDCGPLIWGIHLHL